MSANIELLGDASGDYQPTADTGTLTAAAGALTRGVRDLLKSLKAASVVSHMGQAYYLMSDAQLAALGMTRRDIPARLAEVMNEIRHR